MQEQLNERFSTSQSELLIQGWNAEIVVTTFSNEFVICIIVIRVTSKNIIFINE